jgi:hypothetical protein
MVEVGKAIIYFLGNDVKKDKKRLDKSEKV